MNLDRFWTHYNSRFRFCTYVLQRCPLVMLKTRGGALAVAAAMLLIYIYMYSRLQAGHSVHFSYPPRRRLVSDTHRVSLINSSVQQDSVIVDHLANALKEAREKANFISITMLSFNADIVARGKVRLWLGSKSEGLCCFKGDLATISLPCGKTCMLAWWPRQRTVTCASGVHNMFVCVRPSSLALSIIVKKGWDSMHSKCCAMNSLR